MHRSDEQELITCADCGQPFSVEQGRGFALEQEGGICFDCSVKRGGVYDGLYERWVTPPRMDGLDLSSFKR
jgi:hypothetical protein